MKRFMFRGEETFSLSACFETASSGRRRAGQLSAKWWNFFSESEDRLLIPAKRREEDLFPSPLFHSEICAPIPSSKSYQHVVLNAGL